MIPIVLHHGIFNFVNFRFGRFRLTSFSGAVEDAIAGRGHRLIVSKVHPTASIATRAAELKQTILDQLDFPGTRDDRVIVIAHSMGGLDARYMISRLDMASRVAALVTISSPHRGNAFADFVQRHLGQRLGGFNLARHIGMDVGAINDLTISACRRFNDGVTDSPQVRYFSIGGSRPWNKVPLFALHSWRVVHDVQGANDGLVAVSSGIWGKPLGIWPADHWRQVNRGHVFERNGISNIAPFYLRLLDQLREEGIEGLTADSPRDRTIHPPDRTPVLRC